jgi:hypothetical protein
VASVDILIGHDHELAVSQRVHAVVLFLKLQTQDLHQIRNLLVSAKNNILNQTINNTHGVLRYLMRSAGFAPRTLRGFPRSGNTPK